MARKGDSKAGKHSREKGVGFERKMAREFSSWWGGSVRRTPLSGAYGDEWNMAGDLMFESPFPFYVELKKQEEWTAEHLFEEHVGAIPRWWKKAADEAALANQRPMLIVCRNRIAPLVVFRGSDVEAMPAVNKSGMPRLVRRDWRFPTFTPERTVVVLRLDSLLVPWTLQSFRGLLDEPSTQAEIDFR